METFSATKLLNALEMNVPPLTFLVVRTILEFPLRELE